MAEKIKISKKPILFAEREVVKNEIEQGGTTKAWKEIVDKWEDKGINPLKDDY